MKLTQIDMKFLKDLKPCDDRIKYLPEDFQGTALDILNHNQIPARDKLWVCLRISVLDEKTLRLFSVKCARYATNLLTDKAFATKLNDLIDVSERYALGLATEEGRSIACSTAHSAILDPLYSAAHSSGYSAAHLVPPSAADLAVYSVAHSAGHSTTYSPANPAAHSVAYSVTTSAASSASHSAALSDCYSAIYSDDYSIAYAIAYSTFVEFLIELISPPSKKEEK
jgi:hypothetical protein